MVWAGPCACPKIGDVTDEGDSASRRGEGPSPFFSPPFFKEGLGEVGSFFMEPLNNYDLII